MTQASNGKSEIILEEDALSVERLMVPGGWLYITRYWGFDMMSGSDTSISSTFVPDLSEKKL